MRLHQSAWLVVLLLSVCGASLAQAIDCHGVGLTHSASAVCASTALRALEARVSGDSALVAADPRVRLSQRARLQLRDRCNGNILCLTSNYRNALLSPLPVVPPALHAAVAGTAVPSIFAPRTPGQVLLPQRALPICTKATCSPGDQPNRAAGPLSVVRKPPGMKLLWFLGGMLLAEVLLWKMLTNYCGKCPHCHHWFTRVELDRLTQADSASVLPVLRRRRLRNRALAAAGDIPSFTGSQILAVRSHHQCSLCLHEWETTSQESP